jgi:hypothetical protein
MPQPLALQVELHDAFEAAAPKTPMKKILGLLSLGLAACALGASAQNKPLFPRGSILLAGVSGRMDHLAVDVSGQRLFVAALGNGTVEVLDLEHRKRIQSIPGLQEPQGLAYAPELNRIFVAGGGDGTCRIFDAKTFRLLETVRYSSDADNLRYDRATRRLYVGFGDGALGVLDARSGRRLGEVKLPGHPESFQLDPGSPRIYVNIPSAQSVFVINREKMAVTARWPVREARANFPMALDAADHRLFIGCRRPAKVLVLDTASGKTVANFAAPGDADDLFYDAARRRLYVSGGEGLLDVFDRLDADHYRLAQRLQTAAGARTSLFISELGLLCVALPHRGSQPAEVRIFQATR